MRLDILVTDSVTTISSKLAEALDLLGADRASSFKGVRKGQSLALLLEECEVGLARADAGSVEPLRTLHHFACTGGTLMSRCIEALPNTVLLSEVDPFSKMALNNANFSPHDFIKLAQIGLRPLSDKTIEAVFVGAIDAMHKSLAERGQRLVLRDHTHSHFCTEVDVGSRPLLRDVLVKQFSLRSVVTVRHPLDSFLSLRRNGWVTFTPATFEEYCRRYLRFMECYADTPIMRYEDFVDDPKSQAPRLAALLGLPYVEHWAELASVIKMTGDSGRRGDPIERRERRAVDVEMADECAASNSYMELCERLAYNPDPQAPAFCAVINDDAIEDL